MASGVSETAARFTAWADVYREVWAPVLLPWNLRLLRGLPAGEVRAMLEVGAGVGSLLPTLRERVGPGGRVVGVDRSHGMLRLAPEGSRTAVMDAEALALRDSSFDAAVMPFVLFFVPDPARALRECGRVLRAGGALGVAAWGPDRPFPAERIWTQELDRAGAAPAEAVPRTDELMDDPEKLSRLMLEAGFEGIRAVAEPFEWAADPDGFLRRYSGMGSSAMRYASLPEGVRRPFLARVRRRLQALDPGTLVLRDEVVMAWARVPG